MKSTKFPPAKRKRLNVKKIIKLAYKVRKILEEEGRLPDPDNPDGNQNPARIYFSR